MAGKKLLVADDSLTIQKVIRLALSNEGYEIQAVSDGNDAIQQISLFRPDVVLIDVSLPGKTAFEVKRAINEHQDLEEVRFVLMSSAFEKVDEAQAEEVKFHGRLTKPFDPAHLRQVLSDVLAQVTAKRMEPTSILPRPVPAAAPVPAAETPPPLPFQMPKMPEMPSAITAGPAPTPPPPQAAERLGLALPDHERTNPEMVAPQGHIDLPDDWMGPIAPEEPIVQDRKTEPVGELWDHGEEPTKRLSAPESDDDIRKLTESTIRMSGLDDFQWSVQEPSLKPPPSMLEATGTTFYVDRSESGLDGMPPFQAEHAETAAPSPSSAPPQMPQMPKMPDFSAMTPSDEPAVSPSEAQDLESALSNVAAPGPTVAAADDAKPPSAFYRDANGETTARIQAPPQAPAPSFQADVIPISPEQMETIIRKQLEETFERMAGKMLPEIAERIIKQEIHKMLSGAP